ncbi:MAG: hypothetical protein ACJ74O_01535 [Frankiaceae bacterium]
MTDDDQPDMDKASELAAAIMELDAQAVAAPCYISPATKREAENLVLLMLPADQDRRDKMVDVLAIIATRVKGSTPWDAILAALTDEDLARLAEIDEDWQLIAMDALRQRPRLVEPPD